MDSCNLLSRKGVTYFPVLSQVRCRIHLDEFASPSHRNSTHCNFHYGLDSKAHDEPRNFHAPLILNAMCSDQSWPYDYDLLVSQFYGRKDDEVLQVKEEEPLQAGGHHEGHSLSDLREAGWLSWKALFAFYSLNLQSALYYCCRLLQAEEEGLERR